MCSDSESAGGSSESRSMDSPTASPGMKILHFFHSLREGICLCKYRNTERGNKDIKIITKLNEVH